MKDVLIVGAFHEVIELCESAGMRIVGMFDQALTGEYMGYPVLGSDQDARTAEAYRKYPVIITPDLPKLRMKLVAYYRDCGFGFTSLISPEARISKSASVGTGTVVQAGVNISASATVGDFVKLNTLANIMHDSRIGDFSTVAPNAVVLGRVGIGQACYIGANSTILPEKNIDDNSTVGAGAVVTKSWPAGVTLIGSPARELKK